MSSLDSIVENGQIVEIITDRNRKLPNQDWLKFVKTSNSKGSIRRALKRAQEAESEK
jgi:GTP pyrophosphokinase